VAILALLFSATTVFAFPVRAEQAHNTRILSSITLPLDGPLSEGDSVYGVLGSSGLFGLLPGSTILFAIRANGGVGARVFIVDAANKNNLKIVAKLPLGNLTPTSALLLGSQLFVAAKTDKAKNFGSLFRIDLSDPHSPKIVKKTQADIVKLQASDDKKYLLGTEIGSKGSRSVMIDTDSLTITGDDKAPQSYTFINYPRDDDVRHRPLTTDGATGVTDDTNEITLWDISNKADPKIIRSIGIGTRILDAHFLPDHTTLAALTYDDVITIDISRIAPTSAGLKKTYDLISTLYRSARSADAAKYAGGAAARGIEDAGVEELLKDGGLNLALADRIHILNDYGFWLSQAEDDRALSVLEKVIQLDPNRAVAWLNLGDAARAQIAPADTDDQKSSLWSAAKAAYARYQSLSGKVAAGAGKILAFNVPNSLSAAQDVCDYVADAFNHEGESEISSQSGSVKSPSGILNFEIESDGGSCSTPIVHVEDDPDYQQRPEFSILDSGRGKECGDPNDVLIVPFKGKQYLVSIVDGGPIGAVEPLKGEVCRIGRTYKSKLSENLAPSVCAEFEIGKIRQTIAFEEVDSDDYPPFSQPIKTTDYAHIDGVADILFSEGQKSLRVAHFQISSGAGAANLPS
jgi:hypothetical protein